MNYILFDNYRRNYLLPLTFTRPIAEIRFGILTIKEKWEKYLNSETSYLTEDYLSQKFPIKKEENNILINGSICPTTELVEEINNLQSNQTLIDGNNVIAMRVHKDELNKGCESEHEKSCEVQTKSKYLKLNNVWDIFSLNHLAIQDDFELLTKGRKSAKISNTNTCFGDKIFIEEGAKIECSILNATEGPIYIGKNTTVMEGSKIRGPFALCESSTLKMDAKIYGATTIGPHCKVGGEVGNSVIFGYSNKAHDGYLGNSVLGEWCNLGADTNTSNLKNTYENVRLWSYPDESFVDTGVQFCGLIMGDHSKSGINTMFNTGTVVGVNANIFGCGFHRNFVPSFSWGGPVSGIANFNLNKALKVAEVVFSRRNKDFGKEDKDIFTYIHNLTIKNKRI
ncbi:MAG: GlmU family protein [Bacteroidales bacterium]